MQLNTSRFNRLQHTPRENGPKPRPVNDLHVNRNGINDLLYVQISNPSVMNDLLSNLRLRRGVGGHWPPDSTFWLPGRPSQRRTSSAGTLNTVFWGNTQLTVLKHPRRMNYLPHTYRGVGVLATGYRLPATYTIRAPAGAWPVDAAVGLGSLASCRAEVRGTVK